MVQTNDPLKALLKAVEVFNNGTGKKTAVRLMQTFLQYAEVIEDSAEATQSEIAEHLGIAQTDVSKNITRLRAKGDGLGLLKVDIDPMDERRRTVQLTAKGKSLLVDLKNAIKQG